MKLYCIAGEASGDLHGGNLLKAVKAMNPDIELRHWGGEHMEAAGSTLVKHYRDLAFMGFAEVVMNLKTILGNIKFCKQDILDFAPDAILLIDYPGFNMRIAEWAKKQGIKVIYYISPQIWAWKKNRVHKLKRDVDRMMVILPFEQAFYADYNMDVDFVGHPLLDAVDSNDIEPEADFRAQHKLGEKPLIALLPGSRTQEIKRMLPLMLRLEKEYPDYRFVIAGAPGQPMAAYEPFLENSSCAVIHDATYPLLKHATAALVTSGTATLETALFDTPQVVCYSASPISVAIARRIVKIKYISLVNLIMDAPVVTELIQGDLNFSNLKTELERILPGGSERERLTADYLELRQKLGGGGASKRAAELVLKTL